jgi:pimeloyl-ACP methyl ester carboxylesterase
MMRYFVARGESRPLDASARAGQRGQFATLSDGVTHYELAGPGDGPLVVFVPGLTIPLGFWDGVLRPLHDQGLRTLTYSGYGRGYSDRLRVRFDRPLFVRQLAELIGLVGADRTHLVGTSMGALIALAYARDPASQLASLTLCGPAGLSDQRNPVARLPEQVAPLVGRYLLRRQLLAHLTHNVRGAQDAARLRSLVLEGFAFEGSMYALLSTLMRFPLTGQRELFDARTAALPPTLLLWGDEDHVTPVDAYPQAQTLVRPAREHLFEQCGHMAPFERPAEFASQLATFISEHTT